MFITSFIAVLAVLLVRGDLPVIAYIVIPLITAAVSAVAELYSKNGNDTIICPICAMITIDTFMLLFGGVK